MGYAENQNQLWSGTIHPRTDQPPPDCLKAGEFVADLMLGALSACFHSTLHDILKKKSEIPTIEIIVTGEKRTEVPTTLEWVNLEITVTGDADEKQFLRSVDLAAKYCSVHETISKVARMSHEVKFIH